jgi:hypothetical protein
MRYVAFLPAALAALTDFFVTLIVRANQPDYPDRVIILQVVMFAAALLVAIPQRWVFTAALLLLVGGALISGFSVGIFYVPPVLAATWVVSRRSAAG